MDKANEYVTVRCNRCGEEYGFFPMRVVCLRGCECGNDDYGSPRHWGDGNFTLVKREEWIISNPVSSVI